jgi:hypothetical protein
MTTNELKLAAAFRDAGIEQSKAEMTKTDVDAVRADMRLLEQRLKLWTGGVAIAVAATGFSALFATLHYWPPHMPVK